MKRFNQEQELFLEEFSDLVRKDYALDFGRRYMIERIKNMTLEEQLVDKLYEINSERAFVVGVASRVYGDEKKMKNLLKFIETEKDQQQIIMHSVSLHRNMIEP